MTVSVIHRLPRCSTAFLREFATSFAAQKDEEGFHPIGNETSLLASRERGRTPPETASRITARNDSAALAFRASSTRTSVAKWCTETALGTALTETHVGQQTKVATRDKMVVGHAVHVVYPVAKLDLKLHPLP